MTPLRKPFPQGQSPATDIADDAFMQSMLDEIMAFDGYLSTGKVSTSEGCADTSQTPCAPSVAADREGEALVIVIEVLPTTPHTTTTPALPSISSLPTCSPLPSASSSTPTTSSGASVSPFQRQLVAAGRARYPVARNVTNNPIVRPVAWKRLTAAEEVAATDKYLHDHGALAFTLWLSPEFEADLIASVRAGKKLSQVIADKIRRQFTQQKLPVPHLTFNVEVAPGDRLVRTHLHGVALFDEPIDTKQLPAVREAFKHAAGRISRRDTGRQLDLRQFYNVRSGWRRYASKDINRAIEALGTDQLSYTSRSLVQVVRDDHEEGRESARAQKSVTADVENISQPDQDAQSQPLPASDRPSVTHRGSLTRVEDFPAP